MEILQNFSLKKHNTFGIEAKAKEFVAVHSVDELRKVLEENASKKKFILEIEELCCFFDENKTNK